jgi:hypothetical protein
MDGFVPVFACKCLASHDYEPVAGSLTIDGVEYDTVCDHASGNYSSDKWRVWVSSDEIF